MQHPTFDTQSIPSSHIGTQYAVKPSDPDRPIARVVMSRYQLAFMSEDEYVARLAQTYTNAIYWSISAFDFANAEDATPDLSKWKIADLSEALTGEWTCYSETGLTRMTKEDFLYLADLRAVNDALYAAVDHMPEFDPTVSLDRLVDWFTGKGYAASPFEIRDHFSDPTEEVPNFVADLVSTYDESDEDAS